jgi:hypothetical protein
VLAFIGIAMPHSKTSKEKVREYMERRKTERKPPPDPKQIRRELGWELIEQERDKKHRKHRT